MIANGLPSWGGTQRAAVTTLVLPLTSAGAAPHRSGTTTGAAIAKRVCALLGPPGSQEGCASSMAPEGRDQGGVDRDLGTPPHPPPPPQRQAVGHHLYACRPLEVEVSDEYVEGNRACLLSPLTPVWVGSPCRSAALSPRVLYSTRSMSMPTCVMFWRDKQAGLLDTTPSQPIPWHTTTERRGAQAGTCRTEDASRSHGLPVDNNNMLPQRRRTIQSG